MLVRNPKINLSLDYSSEVSKHKSEPKKRSKSHKPRPKRMLT